MKNSINFQVLNNAARFRSSSALVNALLLLVILVLIPVLIVVGIVVLVTIAVIAKVKTMLAMNQSENIKEKSTKHRNAEEFTDYVVIEEEVGK